MRSVFGPFFIGKFLKTVNITIDILYTVVYNIDTVSKRLTSKLARARKEKKMETMGMTDKQFDAYVRAIMKNLIEAKKEVEESKSTEKLQAVIDDMQKTLED